MVGNSTGNDLPDNNTTVEELKGEEQDAAENIAQGPKKKPAPDGNDGSSSSSGLGGDGEGVGGNAVAGEVHSRAPDQGLIHSSDKSIIGLLTRLGIRKHYDIRMINVEQFQISCGYRNAF